MFFFNIFQFINGIPAACTSTQFNLEMTFLKAVSPYAYMTFFQKFPRRFYFKNITSIILLKINLPVTKFSVFLTQVFSFVRISVQFTNPLLLYLLLVYIKKQSNELINSNWGRIALIFNFVTPVHALERPFV